MNYLKKFKGAKLVSFRDNKKLEIAGVSETAEDFVPLSYRAVLAVLGKFVKISTVSFQAKL